MPDVAIGFAGPLPEISAAFGRENILAYYRALSQEAFYDASLYAHEADLAGIQGSWERRASEWKLQADLAAKELTQVEGQILAAQIRVQIAEKELAAHELQIENAAAIDEFLRDKYTTAELYNRMASQLSSVYFQTYQLAYDLAKRAQRALQYELGLFETTYLHFGYWDSLNKGLLAGEQLRLDLNRMDAAYLEQNRREFELSKHVSLAQWDPVGLLLLKTTGECFVNLPEALFDLDYPGHFRRRIKTVSLTIPSVTGPYTTVNCTLSLVSNRVRVDSAAGSGYAEAENDSRFRYQIGAVQSVVTSSGQNDGGIFEVNLRDERYLPFEGAGAISNWRLELPATFRQFDYETISDVILHIGYTARDGGPLLRQSALEHLEATLNTIPLGSERTGLFRVLSLRREFSTEWRRFLNPLPGGPEQSLSVHVSADLFPFLFRDRVLRFDRLEVVLQTIPEFDPSAGSGLRFQVVHPGGAVELELTPSAQIGGLLHASAALNSSIGAWTIVPTHIPEPLRTVTGSLSPQSLADLTLILHYTV